MASKRSTLLVAVVVLAAALGFAAWRGYFKYPPDTQGTIGAAKRYQANQVSPSDVQLSDEATQAFLQSDLFHRIQTDGEFRKAIIDGGLSVSADGQARCEATKAYAEELGKLYETNKVNQADAGRASPADVGLAVTSLAKAADAMARDQTLAKAVTVESRVIVAAARAEALAHEIMAKDATLGAKLEASARDIAALSRSQDLYHAADAGARVEAFSRAIDQASKYVTEQKSQTDVGHMAEASLAVADLAKLQAEMRNETTLDKLSSEMAKDFVSLSKLVEDQHMVENARADETGEKFQALALNVEGMARNYEGARTIIETARLDQVASRAVDVAKASDANKNAEASKASSEVSSAAKEAEHSMTTGNRAEAERLITGMARDVENLARSLETSRDVVSAKVTDLQRSVEDLARVDVVARDVIAAERAADVAARANELAKAAEASKDAEVQKEAVAAAHAATDVQHAAETGNRFETQRLMEGLSKQIDALSKFEAAGHGGVVTEKLATFARLSGDVGRLILSDSQARIDAAHQMMDLAARVESGRDVTSSN